MRVIGLASLVVAGCVLDLPDEPVLPFGGAGGGGVGGSAAGAGASSQAGSFIVQGGEGGSSPGGEAGSGAAQNPCVGDQKLCGGVCRPRTPEFGCAREGCDPCPAAANAIVGCSGQGECIVTQCAEGFADCDADALPGALLSASTGCEYSFGSVADSTPPLSVPEKTVQVDGQIDDWGGVPAYALRETCGNPGCEDPEFAPVGAFETLPLRTDLDAYFRVAWDAGSLYTVIEVFDPDIYLDPRESPGDPVPADPGCRSIADCEESMTFFFDAFDDRAQTSSYGNDDHRIFFGVGSDFFTTRRPPLDNQRAFRAARIGQACYRIESSLTWRFLTGIQGDQSQPDQFPPERGFTYGFDISVSDWDPDPADETVVSRESQVFWVDPGPDYRLQTSGFGSIELGGPPQ